MIKILVLEDEDAIRMEVTDWLMFEGYEVFEAPNGRIGLEIVQQEIPDLIISDIAMPEMDGYEVLLEVRSSPQLNHIPFIFVTASAERSSVRRGMDMGADDYITKPFTHDELMMAVESHIHKYQNQQQLLQQHTMLLEDMLEEEREKRLLKSRMIAMFSHDFRNPLAVILSSANLILDYEDRLSPERKRSKLLQVKSSVHQLLQMIDEMLIVAELENDKLQHAPEPIYIAEVIQDLVEEFRVMTHDTYKIKYESSFEQEVMLDPKIVRQVTANLISNAVKYSPENSTVTVRLKAVNDFIVLGIADQGMGIPQEDLDNLFEAFHRASNATSKKGTGLGLSIVKQALDICGGKIEVQSELEVGSTFTVYFPIS